ncbi:neuronal acetylcholine receptor subunit alpha-5-like [Branchiostoma floridae x Branchiostoma japonicum]
MADELIKGQFPTCDLFPSPPHACWNPEPEIKNNEVCYHGSGINYRGTWSKTVSGADCLAWQTQIRFAHPWANLEYNFCRNPSGREWPFCYVKDGSEERCDVNRCDLPVCADMGPPDHGSRSPAKRFYNVGEKVTYTCDEGYTLDSRHTSRVRCLRDGIWQYDKPSCSVDIRVTLQDDLLYGYSANQAPDTESENHTVIIFSGTVEQITDLDEKKELLVASLVIEFAWQDSRLKWRPEYHGNIQTLSVSGSSIWTPILTLKRNADGKYQGLSKDVPLQISSDGTVTWTVETLTSTICDADPFFFPADTMECHICFSLSAIKQTIECGAGSSCDVWSPPEQSGEWNRQDKIFAESNTKACFAVHLERIPLFHIATTVGPCIILVVLMIITFVMPIGKGDRISFGVTILLSMVVSLVFVTEVLPVKGALPFFATLIVVCMGLMGLFLFFTMYIITLHDLEGSLSPMAKTFFLYYVAKFLMLGDLTEKETASGEGETGLAGRKLDWSEQANRDIPAEGEEATDDANEDTVKVEVETRTEVSDDVMKVDGKTPADVSETTRDIPVGPPTRLEAAVEEQTSFLRQLIRQAMKTEQQLEELTKAMKNEQKVSDYTLLTKVLDRLCLVLYVISVALTVPMTMYLGK